MASELIAPTDEEMQNVTIMVNRNSIWVHPFYWHGNKYKTKNGTCFDLQKQFCKYDMYEYKQVLDVYDWNTKTLKIPIGFGVDKVTQILQNYTYFNKNTEMVEERVRNIKYIDRSDIFVTPSKIEFKMKLDIRDAHQKDAISFLLNAPKPQKFLSLATGYGKTFCAVYAVCQRKTPAIVISANLSEQWVERIQQYTNIPPNKIINLRGMKSIEKVLKSPKNKHIPFYIISTSSLNLFLKEGGDLDYLLEKMGVGIKIFDEAHSFYSQNAKIDGNSNTRETFYLSATPLRSDFEEKKVFDRIFANIPIHGVNTHYLSKHYTIRVINYNTSPSTNDVLGCLKTRKRFFSSIAYSNYIFSNSVRSMFFQGMLKKLIDELFEKEKNMKLVVILPVLEHITIFEDFLNKFYKPYSVAQYTSNVDVKKRENNLEADVILGTLKSFQEGRDVPGLRAILCATSFSSSLIAQQLLGRLRPIKNENTYYYDFCDVGFKKMKEQRDWRKKEFISRSNAIQTRDIGHEEVAFYLHGLVNNV